MKLGDLLSVIDYGTLLSIILENNHGSFTLWGDFIDKSTIKELMVLSNFEVGLIEVPIATKVKELSIRLVDTNVK